MKKPGLGGKNDDTLIGDSGSGILRGGRGNDIYYIDASGFSVAERSNGGHDAVFATVDYTLDDEVEDLHLSGLLDLNGTGNVLDNAIIGNDGSNLLSGLDGNDVIDGGDGDDTLDGGAGSDALTGGLGNDTAIYAGPVSDYSFAISGTDILVTAADGSVDVLTDIEVLSFSDAVVLAVDLVTDPNGGGAAPAPVALDDTATTDGTAPVLLAVLANDSGQGLQIAAATNGLNGAVTINSDGTLMYQPVTGASGQDTFSYTIIDDQGRTATADVLIQFTTPPPANADPTAVDDSYSATSGTTLHATAGVLANDSDPDGDALSILNYDQTSQGGGHVHMHSDGTFDYTSASGFTGTDSFSYTVDDGNGGTAIATVAIDVTDSGGGQTQTPHYITGLIRGVDYRFNPQDPLGTAVTISYTFADVAPSYYQAGHFSENGFQSFTPEMQIMARDALAQIAQHTNITFVETSDPDSSEIVFGVADIGGGARGVAYYPNGTSAGTAAGDVWIDSSLAGGSFAPGTQGYFTLIHEINHALGLQHSVLPLAEQSQQYTVMSSYDHPTYQEGEVTGLQQYDIAALQYLYGANTTATAGDDTYDAALLEDKSFSIWDAGGHDTLDLSASQAGVSIDLHDGAFSSVSSSGDTDNISIAIGTQIEDAIGSAHDDVISGSDTDNLIFGGDGSDMLTGGGGADRFGFDATSGFDHIHDFLSGTDKIEITGPETSIDDLMLTPQQSGLLIQYSGGSIHLDGVTQVDAGDFVFL